MTNKSVTDWEIQSRHAVDHSAHLEKITTCLSELGEIFAYAFYNITGHGSLLA